MKIIYIIIGVLSLGLGIIGIFVIALPTTPFLLLASYCFARGSQRFHNWFIRTGIYKKHLETFDRERSMTLSTKIKLLVFFVILWYNHYKGGDAFCQAKIILLTSATINRMHCFLCLIIKYKNK